MKQQLYFENDFKQQQLHTTNNSIQQQQQLTPNNNQQPTTNNNNKQPQHLSLTLSMTMDWLAYSKSAMFGMQMQALLFDCRDEMRSRG